MSSSPSSPVSIFTSDPGGFPRTSWVDYGYGAPPFPADGKLWRRGRTLLAAREASKAWKAAADANSWGMIDEPMFRLAVFDRAPELNILSWAGRSAPLRSIEEWRTMSNKLLSRAYHEAGLNLYQHAPVPDKLAVFIFSRQVPDRCYMSGIDSIVRDWNGLAYDIELLDRFDPNKIYRNNLAAFETVAFKTSWRRESSGVPVKWVSDDEYTSADDSDSSSDTDTAATPETGSPESVKTTTSLGVSKSNDETTTAATSVTDGPPRQADP